RRDSEARAWQRQTRSAIASRLTSRATFATMTRALYSRANHSHLLRNDCMSQTALLQSSLTGIPVRRGKVRDVYDFGDRLLIVASDRISAFDWVLPTGIPDKGRVLTQLSLMWFSRLESPNHLLSMNAGD